MTGDKFLPELHLKQTGFTYSTCGPFTKHCDRIQKFRETGNLRHLYGNALDKACFANNSEYSYSKDLRKRTISDKVLRDKVYEIARERNYDGYQRALTSMVYMFFVKKAGSEITVNKELTEELHKPVIEKIKRRKVYERFKDNVWAADLAEMGPLSTKNKRV